MKGEGRRAKGDVLALVLCLLVSACTIAPKTVTAEKASFSGGVQNSSILSFDKTGAIFDQHGRDRYNALIAVYGGYFAPALKADEGMTMIDADGETWHIDNEHLAKAVQMNTWRRSGRPPAPKGMLDRVVEMLK